MGATNIVVEGPTDQFLLSELVRQFITPDNVSELLDLNSIVMVSAESAPSVEKVLVASQWGDEPVPATVVLLDSDGEGDLTKAKITGKNLKPEQASCPEERRGNKKLIEEPFVLQIRNILGELVTGQSIVTTEDILPPKLYAAAIIRYVKRWYPENYDTIAEQLNGALTKPDFSAGGLAAGTLTIFNELILEQARKDYDKMGVAQEAVHLLSERAATHDADWHELKKRLVKLCHEVRRAISASQQGAQPVFLAL